MTRMHGGRKTERVIDSERQLALWSAFVDCYASTSTRAEVNKYLLGLLGVQVEPAHGRTS